MAMTSSQTMNYAELCDKVRAIWMRSESEMVPELRPVMPVDLFKAAIKGNSDVLIPRLGLHRREKTEIPVNIEDSHSAPNEINSEIHSATRFGDTILHLLITEEHNELALMVFQCDDSLLKARNNMLETPLYCAVKVGNKAFFDKLIEIKPEVWKNVVTETNKNGQTAFHVAVIKGYTVMVQKMLEVDPNLACTPFSDGMFPVHKAARMGHLHLVMHFMQKYPDGAELRDPSGRNLFHIAVERNEQNFFDIEAMEKTITEIEGESLKQWREMIERMITAKNYEGNTPVHIAAMEGKRNIMQAIWEHYKDTETGYKLFKSHNNQGDTPFNLSAKQVVKNNKEIDNYMIRSYLKSTGDTFSEKWFYNIMQPELKDKWDRTQVIGLGSVLITTVTFAASFTIPGGYDQDHGTPLLGRRYMFRAFILANTLAFIQGFLSLVALLMDTLRQPSDNAIAFASMSFMVAAGSMVVAFGLGMYVTLASVCLPIAILILVITLPLGTPALILVVKLLTFILGPTMNSNMVEGTIYLLVFYVMSFLFIFCLAFL